MQQRILYAGDTSLDGAASYLTGLMTTWGWHYDYLRSDEPFGDRDPADYGLFIFSDYPANMIDADAQRAVLNAIAQGAGLAMIGGWESFTGCDGHWRATPIGDALPVEMSEADDRVNCDTPVLVATTKGTGGAGSDHATIAGLPWSDRPPLIGGYNRVTSKPDGTILLEARHFEAVRDGETFSFTPTRRDPLLVVGSYEGSRTVALATDVAPHWVGPMVDWGTPRVDGEAPGGFAIEVGCYYARFFRQLLAWAGSSD
jgi:hypothetical protein